jgi:hypothetical protein
MHGEGLLTSWVHKVKQTTLLKELQLCRHLLGVVPRLGEEMEVGAARGQALPAKENPYN